MPIFDQGYQHWSGQLSGHAWRWLAITRQGVRAGMKGRLLRIALLLAWLPAIALAAALCIWGLVERKFNVVTPIVDMLVSMGLLDKQVAAEPRQYRVEVWTLCYHYFLAGELYLSMVLVLMVGPNLISKDLRFNALPLYFSRPLRRIDYFLGKLGIIAAFLGMVVVVPCVIAYVLGLLFSLDLTIIRDTYSLLLASIAYGLVIALSAGTLMLALSSLTRSSRYVALFWIGIWWVSGITAAFLDGMDESQRHNAHYRKMAESRPPPIANPQAANPEDRARQRTAMVDAQQDWLDFQTELFEASKTNWRPLVSYTGNLARVGQQLIGTDKVWARIADAMPPPQREQFLLNNAGPQYPWYWSGGVLAGLFGLSACILNFRVRSMDRLR